MYEKTTAALLKFSRTPLSVTAVAFDAFFADDSDDSSFFGLLSALSLEVAFAAVVAAADESVFASFFASFFASLFVAALSCLLLSSFFSLGVVVDVVALVVVGVAAAVVVVGGAPAASFDFECR